MLLRGLTTSLVAALTVTAAPAATALAADPETPPPPGAPKFGAHKHSQRGKKQQTTRHERQRKQAAAAVRFARKQIGDRYRYGGTGPNSWDCSGLAGGAWRKAGVPLPRTTYAIFAAVRTKVSVRKLKPGDLLFFYSGRSHVGIYVGKGYMIHAPSSGRRVQKVKLRGYYTRNLNGAVRPGL